MAEIRELVDGLGGMAQKQQLVARGARDLDLTLAVRSSSVTRVRNGWYTTMDSRDPSVRAVRVGGRLTGISAIEAMGGWVLGSRPLHVSVPANAARLRTQHNRWRRLRVDAKGGVVLHWDPPDVQNLGSAVWVGLADALLRVALDEPLEDAIAAFDWALHTERLDRVDFESIVLALPRDLQFIADWVDADCESLPESLSRTRLRLAGRKVVSQIPTGVNKSIDLVVEDIVGLEVDGEEFHLTRFYEDRDKDLNITEEGLHALRPSAAHVFYSWDRVERAIDTAIAARGGAPARGISGLGSAVRSRAHSQPPSRRRGRRPTPEFAKFRTARLSQGRRE